jgi:hypothetical protein
LIEKERTMPAMTDTMTALTSLQQAVDSRMVMFQRCKLHPDLQVHLDNPSPGVSRFTYANIAKGTVLATVRRD